MEQDLVEASERKDAQESSPAQHANSDPLALVGTTLFDRYQITSLARSDNKLLVYRAKDNSERRLVTLTTTAGRSGVNQAFEKQAKASLHLQHRNINKPISVETESGRAFLVAEHQDSVSLKELLESQQVIDIEEEIASVLLQVCDALIYAHDKGIAHGNLSPANILFCENEGDFQVVVSDFGFVESFTSVEPFRTDVYKLAVLAYFMITGKTPFDGWTIDRCLSEKPPQGCRPSMLAYLKPELFCIEELGQILEEGMELYDDDWQIKTAQQFKSGLEDWLSAVAEVRAQQEKLLAEINQEDQLTQKAESTTKRSTNIKSTIHSIVKLRKKEINQGDNLAVMFTDKFADAGTRESPRSTAIRLLVRAAAIGLPIVALLFIVIVYPDDLKEAWELASTQLSALVFKDSHLPDEDSLMENAKWEQVFKPRPKSRDAVGKPAQVAQEKKPVSVEEIRNFY
ncbi:MAG: protein kinase, partial [Cyanobacteria bacterium]|nr:protein kinase [Cyanobacteriota bacterium]